MRAALLPLVLAASAAVGAERWAADVRYRMVNEALAQAERVSADWDPGQRDCAGFVRFLYRKATGSRVPLWRRADGSAAEFVSADELVAYNFSPVSRAPARDLLETGDILAFFDPNKPPADAWHLMLVLAPPGTAPDRPLVIYHNGASGPDAAVRKVWLDDLFTGPPEWRPDATNPSFIGTFRWNGWPSDAPREP